MRHRRRSGVLHNNRSEGVAWRRWDLGEVFWFLERVVVRVAEEKGVVLCKREEEKADEGCGEEEKAEGEGCGRGFVQTRRREEEKEEEGCGCGFVQTEKKIRQKGEG
ncbi:hypothetical protein OIU76_022018 [Salix suchowensis]|nr:hypothetical protein OIU76_022018 [Salix suchowensis]